MINNQTHLTTCPRYGCNCGDIESHACTCALPDERKAGGEGAGNSTMYAFTKEQLSSLLFGAIEMCFEHRDVHEHTEESAKFGSVNEMFEGLDAEHELVKEGVTKKLSLQSVYPPAKPAAQIEGLVGALQKALEIRALEASFMSTKNGIIERTEIRKQIEEIENEIRSALAALTPFQSTHAQCSVCEGQEHHWQAGADHQMGAFEECMHCPAIRRYGEGGEL